MTKPFINIVLFFLLGIAGVITSRLSAQEMGKMPPAVYSSLPDWMFQELSHQPGGLRVIGISDPGLSDSVARQQAFLRGLALAAFADEAHGSFLSDLFSREDDEGNKSRYEEIYHLTGKYAGDPEVVTLLHEKFLASGECIQLLHIPIRENTSRPGDSADAEKKMEDSDKSTPRDTRGISEHTYPTFLSEIYLYIREIQSDRTSGMIRKYSWNILLSGRRDLVDAAGERVKEDTVVLDDLSFFRINRKASGIRSSLVAGQIAYDSLEFYYTGRKEPPSDADVGSTMVNGLWIAYLTDIMEKASIFIKQKGDETARVTDHTSSMFMELNREKEVLEFRLQVEKLGFDGRHMQVGVICNKL